MPREEVHRLCDIHLAVFRESLEKEKTLAPAGHPIHILMEEHRLILEFASQLKSITSEIKMTGSFERANEKIGQLINVVSNLKESGSHYMREENVLFPYLEKHGVTQPPAIMWMEHDRIRDVEKNLYRYIDIRETMVFKDFTDHLEEGSLALSEIFSSHFYKENNILFPTALKVIGEGEWKDIRKQFDELGYCRFTPKSATATLEKIGVPIRFEEEGVIAFETGNMSKEEIEAIFSALPVEITFVDKDDTVRFFTQTKDRIFVRTKAVIGRKVQQCHPQKSIHIVNQILEAFKNGSRDVAEFWTPFKGRLVHIRYFPVRNKNGDYLGCMEVTQDITDIKTIEGVRRLLDWK